MHEMSVEQLAGILENDNLSWTTRKQVAAKLRELDREVAGYEGSIAWYQKGCKALEDENASLLIRLRTLKGKNEEHIREDAVDFDAIEKWGRMHRAFSLEWQLEETTQIIAWDANQDVIARLTAISFSEASRKCRAELQAPSGVAVQIKSPPLRDTLPQQHIDAHIAAGGLRAVDTEATQPESALDKYCEFKKHNLKDMLIQKAMREIKGRLRQAQSDLLSAAQDRCALRDRLKKLEGSAEK